jgi:hypothetical protein
VDSVLFDLNEMLFSRFEIELATSNWAIMPPHLVLVGTAWITYVLAHFNSNIESFTTSLYRNFPKGISKLRLYRLEFVVLHVTNSNWGIYYVAPLRQQSVFDIDSFNDRTVFCASEIR